MIPREGQPQESGDEEVFDVQKSPIKEAYLLFGASTPLELSNLYTKEDQILLKSGQWDYDNPELITNKIKTILEQVDPSVLDEEEKDWRQEILWFWYHHAISVAFYNKRDIEQAKIFAAKALECQPAAHPNQITRLLYFLVNGQLAEAEEWASSINDEVERETAISLIEEYKNKA